MVQSACNHCYGITLKQIKKHNAWHTMNNFKIYMVHTHTIFCTVIVIRTSHSYLPHQSSKQLLCYFLVNTIAVLAVW